MKKIILSALSIAALALVACNKETPEIQIEDANFISFKAYVAAGMQADWNVSTQLNTEGAEQTISRDRMQWSVNSSLGLQYDITPRLSLYAEPGINYHFDNGSTVRNFFKDKPTNLKLQIGVRLNLNKGEH